MKNDIKLTKEQKECVDFKAGDLLVKGVAGSGKSYVILKRALKLYKESPGKASIKIFTYTNALVKYTDELLQAKLGEDSIEVSTVDRYFGQIYKAMTGRYFFSKDKKCQELVDEVITEYRKKVKADHRFFKIDSGFWLEEFQWIQEKCLTTEDGYIKVSRKGRGSKIKMMSEYDKKLAWSMYENFRKKSYVNKAYTWPELYLYINENLSKIPERFKVDYVFVDEAQDMTVGKLRALKAITKKSITIAADMAQKIYKTSFTWKEAGIDIQGRASKSLRQTFRSTKQIVTLAEDLMVSARKDDSLKGELTELVLPISEGPKPIINCFRSKLKEEAYLTELISQWLSKDKSKTIGVICKTKKYYYRIRAMLAGKKIEYQEIFHDGNYTPEWKLLEPGVKLIVAKSSKGLEFDTVIIPDVDEGTYPFGFYNIDPEQLEDILETERNLLYVAMTRARENLYILCTEKNKSRFIGEFKPEHYEGSVL